MCATEAWMVLNDLQLPVAELSAYCQRNGIRRLELFGSATRADFGPQSDVDLLVEFRPEARIGFLAPSRMPRERSVLFGRCVDLVPRAGLKPMLASFVLKEARPLYAERQTVSVGYRSSGRFDCAVHGGHGRGAICRR